MADDFQEDIRISELPEADSIDKDTDFLAVVKPSTLYTSGFKSFKVKASKLPGGGGGASSADDVTYDNSVSGLEADNVQEALDELAQSSGGSTVEVTQVQTTGTRIATITVDEVDTDLYAPNGSGASAFEDLTDVDINSTTLSNGQVPVYNSTSEKWENGTISSGSGHTIVDNEGVSLTQRDELQFKGAYSEDDSTDEKTVVNVVREMTKAEFDELTEEEKTGFINIIDITGGDDARFQPVIYSEDEREIGVWIDGKPLYQKTIVLQNVTVPTSSGYTYDITSLNIDAPVETPQGFIVLSSGTDKRALPFNLLGNYGMTIAVSRTSVVLSRASADITCDYVIFTIRYTKTTDAAGSGQWTPQGVPAHHYSEDAQVIGTWIDGSTLYEKVVDLGSDTNISQTQWFPTTLTGFSNIIQCSTVNTAGAYYPLMTSIQNDYVNLLACRDGNPVAARYVTIRYTKSST